MSCSLDRIDGNDVFCDYATKTNAAMDAIEQNCSDIDLLKNASGYEDLTAKTAKQGTGTLIRHDAIYFKNGKVITQSGSIRINGIDAPGIAAHRFEQVLGITADIEYLAGTVVMNNANGNQLTVGGRLLPWVSDNSIIECNIPYDAAWGSQNVDIQYSINYKIV